MRGGYQITWCRPFCVLEDIDSPMTDVAAGLPFQVYAPGLSVWMNKGAPEGKQRRIGGLISTDNRDKQGEIVIQKGLDFSDFLSSGWFNDNHSKDTDSPVGYPDSKSLKYVRKGEILPDGRSAPGNGHWSEGYLLENIRGNKIWDTALALHKAGDERRLGFSIEGTIQKRIGDNRKTIAKARVKNVAITNCPVNLDTRMETLVKSMIAIEESQTPEELWKALGMGTGGVAGPAVQPAGPQTGATAGQVLAPESLEQKRRKNEDNEDEESEKSLTPERAWEIARVRFPFISAKQVGQLVGVAHRLKAQRAA